MESDKDRDMTRKLTQQALLYEIRRLVKKDGRDFTNAELLKFLDTIADAKAQE